MENEWQRPCHERQICQNALQAEAGSEGYLKRNRVELENALSERVVEGPGEQTWRGAKSCWTKKECV